MDGVNVAEAEEKCSRQTSGDVRWLLEHYFWPEVGRYEFPEGCPLNATEDMWKLWDEQKNKVRRTNWRCNLCGKSFRSETYIDKHIANKHPGLLVAGSDACLAELCDVVHCEHVEQATSLSKRFRYRPSILCNSTVKAERREACEDLARTCFPPQASKEAKRLNAYFQAQFCRAHSCDRRLRVPLPLGQARTTFNSAWLTCAIIAGLCLTVWYVVAGCLMWERSAANAGDLKRLGRPRGRSWWSWLVKKKKAY
ncbi:unnamed protein product [Pedinophyceae sp. YPF-701]|nr:unnamed protein product [Pedinophyceae sp. YPF-701]